MRRLLATTGILLAALILGTASAEAAGLEGIEDWAFAIGNRTLEGDLPDRYGEHDLVVFDGQEAKRSQIAAVQASGTIVLGYLSVGTIEDYRPWYRKLKRYRIEAWKDWEGEYFARVGKRGYRRQIGKRIAPKLYRKGFDGLFLDNVDMIESYRREAKGMRKLVARLGRLVHGQGGYLFAQNGFEVIGPMLKHLDGWNREAVTGSYDFDRDRYLKRSAKQVAQAQEELGALGSAGLLVTATDYTRKPTGAIVGRAIANACEAGALPYVSDIELRRTPAVPQRC